MGSSSGTNIVSSSAKPCETLLEAAVAERHARMNSAHCSWRIGAGVGGPQLAGFLVAQVDSLARPVADRVVATRA